MDYLMIVCAASMGVGAVVGAAVVGYMVGRTNWINAVRRFKNRKRGRWQLTYHTDGPARIRPRHETSLQETKP